MFLQMQGLHFQATFAVLSKYKKLFLPEKLSNLGSFFVIANLSIMLYYTTNRLTMQKNKI
jgi:hypothetical protein